MNNLKGYFEKGYIPLSRQTLFSVFLDQKLSESEKFLFLKFLCIAWPYNFNLSIDDGQGNETTIKIKKGDIYCDYSELVSICGTSRKVTILHRLKTLNKYKYIQYKPRQSRHENFFHIKVKDYDLFIDNKSIITENATIKDYHNGKRNDKLFTITESDTIKKFTITESDTIKGDTVAENDKVTSVDPNNFKENLTIKRIYNNIVVNNNIQQHVVDEFQSLFKKKSKRNISSHIIQNLLQRFTSDVLLLHIYRLNLNKADNPIGLLIDSLENPDKYDLIPTEEEIREIERSKMEEKQKLEDQKIKEEKKQIEIESKEYEYFKGIYNNLPENKQKVLEERAREMLVIEGKEKFGLDEEKAKACMLTKTIIQCKINEFLKKEEGILKKIKRITAIGLSLFISLSTLPVWSDDLPSLEILKIKLLQNNIDIQIKKQEIFTYKFSDSFLSNIKFTSSYNFELDKTWYGVMVQVPLTFGIPYFSQLKFKKLELERLKKEKIEELENMYYRYQNIKEQLKVVEKDVEQKRLYWEYKKMCDLEIVNTYQLLLDIQNKRNSLKREVAILELEISNKKREVERVNRDYKLVESLRKEGMGDQADVEKAEEKLSKLEYDLLVLEKKLEGLKDQLIFMESEVERYERLYQSQKATLSSYYISEAEKDYLACKSQLANLRHDANLLYSRITMLCGL